MKHPDVRAGRCFRHRDGKLYRVISLVSTKGGPMVSYVCDAPGPVIPNQPGVLRARLDWFLRHAVARWEDTPALFGEGKGATP